MTATYYQKRKCRFCHKTFDAYIYNIKKGFGKYCSKACSNRGNKLGFKKGHTGYPAMLGRKMSKESREKMRLAKVRNPTRYWQGKQFSEDHKRKLKESLRKRWDLIGRKTNGKDERVKDHKYLEWRTKVLKRDNYRCILCASKDRLIADHIKAWRNHPKLRYRLSNGRTLCYSCHLRTPNYGTKTIYG